MCIKRKKQLGIYCLSSVHPEDYARSRRSYSATRIRDAVWLISRLYLSPTLATAAAAAAAAMLPMMPSAA